ncbi:hypothetical protein FHW88_005207 [Mucilaginibacter sp. SG538B]|uniref:DUF488 domain-containing protein n=1 Tax=Mucilaginibacter sp. SG538B TaxID=2587021 RepID=UPI001795D23C|nr:DUF488 domain-containing protein [Mucilaginibacter sp. SG538B]NVM66889.1 hypothetical protein [Mucilaginibacter sp. SG538B]
MADLKTLTKYNIVRQDDQLLIKYSDTDYLKDLKPFDRKAIGELKIAYGDKSGEELTKSTYISHPYYAINSLIAKDILSPEQYQRVLKARPVKSKTVLFTIGYEGITLEEYLNRLLLNDVRILCDVRNNPISMKFGFSKNQLENACSSIGINYLHLPQVGIQSEDRQDLKNQADYDQLFKVYRETTLQNTTENQKFILSLLQQHERIALTCFEANICQCHRKPLAEAIVKLDGWAYDLRHL